MRFYFIPAVFAMAWALFTASVGCVLLSSLCKLHLGAPAYASLVHGGNGQRHLDYFDGVFFGAIAAVKNEMSGKNICLSMPVARKWCSIGVGKG